MKKIVSLMVAAIMLVLPFSAFADSTASEDMQRVLLLVKEKVDVPTELSEFSSHIATSGGEKSYSFEWANEDYSKSLSIYCDDLGRITSYYDYSFDMSDKKLSAISKAEIIAYAQAFLQQIIPEAFENEEDKLVYDESSYNARGNLRYSLEFDRYRNSLPVKDNSASITVCVAEDKLYVRNMSANFRYDAEFEDDTAVIENYVQKYTEAFPVELIYCDEYNYNAKRGEARTNPVLVYRIKDNNIGYISMGTGEAIEEDTDAQLFREENAMMDTMATGGGSVEKEMLTEQEIAEIGNVQGLLSVQDIEKMLKALPYMDFSSSLKLSNSYLTKNESGEYSYRLHYSSEDKEKYRYLSAVVNAHNGKLISISNNVPYDVAEDAALTEKQKEQAAQKMLSFLNKVAAEELKNSVKDSCESYGNNLNDTYVRIVNDIEYVDSIISISFDAKNNLVRSFSADFRDGDFADPDAAIGEEAAYEKVLEYSPVSQMYIQSGGKYVKAATLEKRAVKLDALTGEIKDSYESENKNYEYSDMDGHWAQEAATKLAEIQVGIEGGELKPDSSITQEEFFRLVCSGMINKYYSDYTEEELYDILIAGKILEEGEKSPDSDVTREKAFVYIIRLAGLERVAKLDGIYKIEYADGALVSGGSIGYAAILSGLNVICGDGGYLRPQDKLTRAETMIMLYRYLLTL